MPAGNGTGPMGMGPMTGRAAGYCAGYSVPGYINPVMGRGMGFGRGRGLGMGRGFRGGRGSFNGPMTGWPGYGGAMPMPEMMTGAPYGAAPTSQQEIDALKGQSEYLENALGGIQKRIEELETEEKK